MRNGAPKPKPILDRAGLPSTDAALLVVLRSGSRPALSVCERYPIRRLALGNTRYLHVGKVSLMFYDWLRDGNNQLLGMRVCRFADWEELCKSLAHLDGVVVAGDQIGVEIYLSEERAIEPALSCDQAFMYNELFRSRDGECVLAFGCECLGESDWKRLHDLDVEWVQFQVEVCDPLERTLSGVKAKVLDAVFTSSMKVDRWSGRVVKWINRTK